MLAFDRTKTCNRLIAVERLLSVLDDIDAVTRGDERRIRPGSSHLLGPGHILMSTRFGDFDCLGSIDGDRTYENLLPSTLLLDLEGRRAVASGSAGSV